jgi:hypothetical protein
LQGKHEPLRQPIVYSSKQSLSFVTCRITSPPMWVGMKVALYQCLIPSLATLSDPSTIQIRQAYTNQTRCKHVIPAQIMYILTGPVRFKANMPSSKPMIQPESDMAKGGNWLPSSHVHHLTTVQAMSNSSPGWHCNRLNRRSTTCRRICQQRKDRCEFCLMTAKAAEGE